MDEALTPQIIEAAGRGNLIAIYQVFAETRDPVYFAAKFFVREDNERAAVLGDAYLQAIGRMSDYDFRQPFHQFVIQKTAERSVRLLKGKKVVFAIKDAMMAPFDDRELFSPDILESEQKRWEILRMIDSLPDPQRLALVLHYFAGMQTMQIAKIFGVDERAAAYHLSGAKNAIRSHGAPPLGQDTPALTTLLERESQTAFMPRDLAKAVFERMMMVFMSGEKVKADSTTSASSPSSSSSGYSSAPEKEGGTLRTIITIGVVVGVFAAVFIGYYLIWRSGDSKVAAEHLDAYERSKAAVEESSVAPPETDDELDPDYDEHYDPELEAENDLDLEPDGEPDETDEDGNPPPEIDEDGNPPPEIDEDGNPPPEIDEDGNPPPELDDDGEAI